MQNTAGAVADKVVFISTGLSDNPAVSVTLRSIAVNPGEGKRRKEFAEWYVEWRAEWHNYAKYDLRGE